MAKKNTKAKAKGGVITKFAQVLSKKKPKNSDDKYGDKLKKIDSSLKVWVGGLGKDFPWKKLETLVTEHVKKPTLTHVYPGGTACVAMPSEDDVATAVASLNGAELAGKTLEVDVWVKGEYEKKEKVKKPKKPKVAQVKKQVTKPAKGKAKAPLSKADEKMREKLKAVDPSLKVWVGGLSAGVTWQKLRDHFKESGFEPKLVEIMKKGAAVVTVDTADAVASAVAMLNGTELAGKAIEVDLWVKPERKPKAA